MIPETGRDISQDNGQKIGVSPRESSIFRAEARRHYLQNQEKIVLPPLVSSRVFLMLWLLSLLLMTAGAVIVFWPLI